MMTEAVQKLRRIDLREGVQLVPDDLEIINPERMGECSYLYAVWLFPVDPPMAGGRGCEGMGIGDALQGGAIGHPFGWLSDHPDLHIFGQRRKFPVEARHDSMAMEVMTFLDAVLTWFDGQKGLISSLEGKAVAAGWARIESITAEVVEHGYTHFALDYSKKGVL